MDAFGAFDVHLPRHSSWQAKAGTFSIDVSKVPLREVVIEHIASGRLPSGVRALADQVRAQGMRFGIWMDPELIHPDSDLGRAQPDWLLRAEGSRPLARSRMPLLAASPGAAAL